MKYEDKQLTGNDDFESKMGEDFTRKVVLSILKAQAELLRTYSLPMGSGGYIVFYGDTLVWSLIGNKASKAKEKAFLKRPDYNDIMKFALNSFEKNRLLSRKELSLVEREIREFSIEVFPTRSCKDKVIPKNDYSSPYTYIKRLLISFFK